MSFDVPYISQLGDPLWRLPSAWEQRDATTAVAQLGGKVLRTGPLSIRRSGQPATLRRNGGFDEEAFRTLDRAVWAAKNQSVRVVLPLIDGAPAAETGGTAAFAAFRDAPPEAFYSDPGLRGDWKAVVAFLLNRVNTATGVAYRDEPAIMAWQVGSNLDAPNRTALEDWVLDMASFIKAQDPNHLVFDGTTGARWSQQLLSSPDVDAYTGYYTGETYQSLMSEVQVTTRAGKAQFVSSFGLMPLKQFQAFCGDVINSGMSGAFLTMLTFRSQAGGFYTRQLNQDYWAYSWPGISPNVSNGFPLDNVDIVGGMRYYAGVLDGREYGYSLPEAAPPAILTFVAPNRVRFQGSPGARVYALDRSEDYGTMGPNATWINLRVNLSESELTGPGIGYLDETAVPGRTYWYAMKAINENGWSGLSNIRQNSLSGSTSTASASSSTSTSFSSATRTTAAPKSTSQVVPTTGVPTTGVPTTGVPATGVPSTALPPSPPTIPSAPATTAVVTTATPPAPTGTPPAPATSVVPSPPPVPPAPATTPAT
ncbi:glycoside hydrolase superfamily [Hyaloraphidium curvatum]|nr:glycoside hydrolase superfamily [Hyaloraphidium curvatum]